MKNKIMKMPGKKVIVVGAGAAGMIAAGRAAACGARVTLLEKTDGPGKKILISGKTRCNISNATDLETFTSMYGDNGKFLRNIFHRFFREELLELLGKYGLETKVERGGRIFPVSDDARDVVRALESYLSDQKVHLQTGVKVQKVIIENNQVLGVFTDQGRYPADAVIIAAGGASYPATGSSGDGFTLAKESGHAIIPTRPALVPLLVREVDLVKTMQGVSLRNVRLTAWRGNGDEIDFLKTFLYDCGRGIKGKRPPLKVIESRQGEMMMTHFGIGGPITLQMSLAVVDALRTGDVIVSIDLKPALTVQQVRERLQRDFDLYSKRNLKHIFKGLLPQKMIEPMVLLTGINGEKSGSQINGEERDRIVLLLKALRFHVKGSLPLTSAMVTAGGVDLKEIDPRTLASKIISGLYFCGEVMDIDADTGGYNLQAAFSTGYVAGEAASSR